MNATSKLVLAVHIGIAANSSLKMSHAEIHGSSSYPSGGYSAVLAVPHCDSCTVQ